jgi:serine/threonine protein kinase/Flp pilus assembly protein TadD
VDEFLARYRRGERPALTEYTARHPELAEQIRELFPGLAMLEDVRPEPQTAADAARDAAFPRRLGEYRLVREIGRGGMGVVYEAEQESLGRRVALKVLPPGAAAHPQQVERFRREARAAARLHHTNIVPVFGVGEEDGTHFYVMQYIEGRPLDEVLEELRRLRDKAEARPGATAEPVTPTQERKGSSADVARSLWNGRFHAAGCQEPLEPGDPDLSARLDDAVVSTPPPTNGPLAKAPSSSRPLSDPHRPFAKSVAQLGVQVAGALEYAAAQGILHRDVKPSNLLLDVWGTVWLTDFGLAKAAGTPDLTRPGGLFGTLRYLAPERFQGRADVRSDVYALGLTLYEVLALKPAFGGHDEAELTRRIATGATIPLDRVNPYLPRDLVTIVHKAIATDPADRYQTAGALAEDLCRFLDDRPIAARRLSLLEQTWRWCRRNPAGTGLAAALLALLLLASGGAVWLLRLQAQREAEASRRDGVLRQEAAAALTQAVRFRQGFHFREARELLEQARQRLEPARQDALLTQVDQAQADLDLAEHLDAARLQAASLVNGKFDPAGAEPLYAAAFAEAGLGREGEDIEAAVQGVRASAVRAELVAALDDWASITQDRARRAWLLAVASGADRDAARDRLRQPELWHDGPRLTQVAEELRVAELSPQLATALGRVARDSGGEALPLLTAAQARFPQDFWLNFELGWALHRAQRWDEALGYYRAALALRPEASVVHNNLGLALSDKGRADEGVSHLRQGLRLDPKSGLLSSNLLFILLRHGRQDEAISYLRQAVWLDPKSAAMAHNNLGFALQAKGRFNEAFSHYQESVRLEPESDAAYVNLGGCLHDAARAAVQAAADRGSKKAPLGEAERAGLRRQALQRLRANLDLKAKLLKDRKLLTWSLTTWQTDPALAGVRDRRALDKLPNAEREQWQRLWADVAALLAADPLEQGRMYAMRRDWAQAAACYARASKLRSTDYGHFWFEYAAVLLLSGDHPGYAKACARMVEDYGKVSGLRAYHVARACTLAPDSVADAARPGHLAEKELTDQAREFWSLTEQGALHYRAGRYKDAVPLLEQSLRADPKSGRAALNWMWLALANQHLGKPGEARRWLDQARVWLDRFGDGMPSRAEEELGLHLHNWLEAHILRREAEALMDTGAAKPQ